MLSYSIFWPLFISRHWRFHHAPAILASMQKFVNCVVPCFGTTGAKLQRATWLDLGANLRPILAYHYLAIVFGRWEGNINLASHFVVMPPDTICYNSVTSIEIDSIGWLLRPWEPVFNYSTHVAGQYNEKVTLRPTRSNETWVFRLEAMTACLCIFLISISLDCFYEVPAFTVPVVCRPCFWLYLGITRKYKTIHKPSRQHSNMTCYVDDRIFLTD